MSRESKYQDGETFVKKGRVLIYVKGERYKEYSRYLWQEFNGLIPDGCVIHHIDFNPLNNRLDNLQMMTGEEHKKIHHTGKMVSEESRLKMSEAKKGNTYRRGSKHTDEAKEKNRQAHLGKSPANKGKKMSEEQKKLLSEKLKEYNRIKKLKD